MEMEVDLTTSADLYVSSDHEPELLNSLTLNPANKPGRLGGAVRKRLSRLRKSRIPYESALQQILEWRALHLHREVKQPPLSRSALANAYTQIMIHPNQRRKSPAQLNLLC